MVLIIDGDYNDTNKTEYMTGILLNSHTDEGISGFITADIEKIV